MTTPGTISSYITAGFEPDSVIKATTTVALQGSPGDCAYPASAPPPIMPWNGFDLTEVNDYCLAVRLVAEILMDDEWHPKNDVIEEMMWELDFTRKRSRKLLSYLRIHGDIRQAGDDIRLTTRWRGWSE